MRDKRLSNKSVYSLSVEMSVEMNVNSLSGLEMGVKNRERNAII